MPKYLVITGASKGIGKSTAELFHQEEWTVVNLSRTACPIKDAINLSVDLSRHGWHFAIGEQLSAILATAAQICLVHNAAAHDHDDVFSLQEQRFREILEINVVAPTILNKLCLPYMRAGSSIIYIGSTLAEKAVKGTFSYSTSKHASIGMMRATCQDLIGSEVHTACVCPGFTDTEMLRQHLHHDEAIMDAMKGIVTAHRFIEPVEIAQVILFCAKNPVLNGAVLHANLGQIER